MRAKPVQQYKKVVHKEAIVAQHGEVNSPLRQIKTKSPYGLKPLYIKQSDGYIRNGVIFAVNTDGKIRPYTATHVTGKECFYKNNDRFYSIRFTPLNGDLSVSEDAVPFVGKPLKMSEDVSDRPEALQLHTLDINDDSEALVNCSGTWDGDKYIHSSDTFGSQCGSPYVYNGIVYATHAATDSKFNYGLSVHAPDMLF
jgi:hypothetical protein